MSGKKYRKDTAVSSSILSPATSKTDQIKKLPKFGTYSCFGHRISANVSCLCKKPPTCLAAEVGNHSPQNAVNDCFFSL